jgi:hypothetical protein
MADALVVPLDRYKKYETRGPMPAYLIERFALFVGRDVDYVLTGKRAALRSAPLPTRSQAPNRRRG